MGPTRGLQRAGVLLVFTHKDKFRASSDLETVQQYLSQMVTRAFLQFEGDLDFLVCIFFCRNV